MILTAFAAALCAALFVSLRNSLATGGSVQFAGFDGVGVIFGFVAFVMAATAFGPTCGIYLILSVLLHELGHVLGYRMIGHTQVRFRLIPLLCTTPISDTSIRSEGEAFLVALMGPGLSLAPMVMAFSLATWVEGSNPALADQLRLFVVTCAALNFINLMPFWPLDGGRCARIAAANFWPALAPAMTVFMASAFLSAGIRLHSLMLLFLAVVGLQSLLHKGEPPRRKMGPDHALIGLAAYTFTLAAHFLGMWWYLGSYF